MGTSSPKADAASRRNLTGRLLARGWRYRGLILVAFGAMLLSGLSKAAPIFLADVFVDHILAPKEVLPGTLDSGLREVAESLVAGVGAEGMDGRLAVLWLVSLLILATGLIAGLATFINEYLAKYLASLVVKDLRVDLLDRLLVLPLSFFTRRKIGDLISRFSNDTQATFRTLNIFISEMTLQPVVVAFGVVAIVVTAGPIGLVALVLVPLIILPVVIVARRVHKRSKKALSSMGDVTESLNQVLSGLRVVKAFRMHRAESRRYQEANQDWLERHVALTRTKAKGRAIMEIVYTTVLAALVLIGGYFVIQERYGMTAGDFVAVLTALAIMYRPLRRLSVAYHNWQESTAAAARIFEVLDLPGEPADTPDARDIGPIRESIRFDGVSFAYEGEQEEALPVLRDLDFEIPAGRTVALVGPSGAGKSTIADLLFRFYEPTRGRILVDGVPLDRVSRDSLLAQVAVVSQSPFVFNATVRENIAYARPEATDAEIVAAAEAAQIHDVITRLPDGYSTVVGDRGASLSGGQLQRITIARAILKNASLLLLDEATSSLDTESERAVQDALRNLLAGKTALVIAHRLSTIAHADRILVIDHGRIVEQGTHDELMARTGLYSRLYRAQTAA